MTKPKKILKCCGLNLAKGRKHIIALSHSCCLHDFSIDMKAATSHRKALARRQYDCVAPPFEYSQCQFKMTSSKYPYRTTILGEPGSPKRADLPSLTEFP